VYPPFHHFSVGSVDKQLPNQHAALMNAVLMCIRFLTPFYEELRLSSRFLIKDNAL